MTEPKRETSLDKLREVFLLQKAIHLGMIEMGRNSKVVSMSGEPLRKIENSDLFDQTFLNSFVEDGVVIRSEEELLKVEGKLGMMLWYGRHKGPDAIGNRNITPEQLESVEKCCKELEEEYPGDHDLEPLTGFEWGELSGRVSAIRWVLGDEWGNLNT